MTVRSAGSRTFQFVRSLVVLAALAVAVPAGLAWAARERFGGALPFHGVPSPAEWEPSRIWAALTEQLTEQTIADIVIRTALVVAWVALAVFVLTVIAETWHMVRHAGMHLPDMRGLGSTQHLARIVAAGLLVVVPVFSSPERAVAKGDTALTPLQRVAVAAPVFETASAPLPSTGPVRAVVSLGDVVEAPTVEIASDPTASPSSAPAGAPVAGTNYVVRAGDSVFAIAGHVVGQDPVAVADYADRIIDANTGQDMGDGRRFVNAAFIDVGWVLRLPPIGLSGGGIGTPSAEPAVASPEVHVVERGESLWSIAEDELGDPTRWPELYEENAGRSFDDGRTLSDPDLIHPGWTLELPGGDEQAPVDDDTLAGDSAADLPVPVINTSDTPADDTAIDAAADGVDLGWEPPVAEERLAPPAPDVVWVDTGGTSTPSVAPAAASGAAVRAPDGAEDAEVAQTEHLGLVTLRAAAMLSGGLLTLLAVRRRAQLRQAAPRARLARPTESETAIERILRASDAGERLARVDIAIRAAALALVEQGRRVQLVLCAPDGEVEVLIDGPVSLPGPWHGEHERWVLPAATPIEMLAPLARQVGAPCPTLVQLGVDEIGRDVYADLEALEAIEIAGSAADADAIVAAVAMTLAGSALAEVTTLVAVEVPDDAFVGHRLHRRAPDPVSAFEVGRRAIGATATVATSTFELRSRVTSGETWEPAVVLLGSAVEVVRPPRDRTGLAVVSAAPIEGPSSRLAPEDGVWILRPAGIRMRPIGLRPPELDALADLMHGAAVPPTIPDEDDMQLRDDHDRTGDDTIYEPESAADPDVGTRSDATGSSGSTTGRRPRPVLAHATVAPTDDWQLLVRVLGPVDVVGRDGGVAEFERSKTKELVAWLATHRDRSTRVAARTALWEHDVRDATFANVVSEARRALARLVEPATGEEWVGRTMTDALPMHAAVRTDAELLEAALRAARVQPPDQAIVTLAPAVERITGMPFEGTTYLWPDAEGITSSLVLLATSAAAELAAHCLSVGDVEGVFRATGRGLRVLAGHEELIGLRMRAHARVGDLAGVRSEWETYERMITADPWSDGEPSPKLVDLRTQLLNPSR